MADQTTDLIIGLAVLGGAAYAINKGYLGQAIDALLNLKLPSLNIGSNVDDGSKAIPPSSGGGSGTPISGGTVVNGIKIPYKLTGKSIKMNVGARHPNGDRYNGDHSFTNYYVVGYYKTQGGSGHRLIEMKTDGGCHGCGGKGCGSLPKCEWAELDFDINTGQAYISSEYPHPVNHPAVTQGVSAAKLTGSFVNKEVGFGVAAWTDTDGYRVYEEWIDPGGNQWIKVLHAKNTGQIIPNPKRSLPFPLEAEIRMNDQHGTSMRGGMIYEIVPNSAAMAKSYHGRRIYAPLLV